jgi:hypothetical protein
LSFVGTEPSVVDGREVLEHGCLCA